MFPAVDHLVKVANNADHVFIDIPIGLADGPEVRHWLAQAAGEPG